MNRFEKAAYGGSYDEGEYDRWVDGGPAFGLDKQKMIDLTRLFAEEAAKRKANLKFYSDKYSFDMYSPDEAIKRIAASKDPNDFYDDTLPNYYDLEYPRKPRSGILEHLRLKTPGYITEWGPEGHPMNSVRKAFMQSVSIPNLDDTLNKRGSTAMNRFEKAAEFGNLLGKIAYQEKKALLLPVLSGAIGSGIGMYNAPEGHKGEGASRGFLEGANTFTGGALGGLAPAILLASSGYQADSDLKQALRTAAILGGAGLGSYGGYKLTNNMLGRPSWELNRKKSKPADRESNQKKNEGLDKNAFLLPATVGAGIGAYRAPEGSKGEGAARGAVRGIGTDLGAAAGALAGIVGLGSLQGSRISDRALLAAVLASSALGGYGGYKLTGSMLGRPSWEINKGSKKKKDVEK